MKKLHVNVNIMMGLPGSGKSYYAEKNHANMEKRENDALSVCLVLINTSASLKRLFSSSATWALECMGSAVCSTQAL